MNTETIAELTKNIVENVLFTAKEVLTIEEAVKYTGLKKSYLYKLTMNRQIPYYKPTGKVCYFNRLELERWMQSNRISTDDELSMQAQTACMKKGGKK